MTGANAKPRRIHVPATLLLVLWLLAAEWVGAALPVYEIRRDGALAGYLVGTMHSEDPRVTAQMPTLLPLIRQVDTVALELLPDGVEMLLAGAAMLLPGDQRLSELLGEERFARLVDVAAPSGLPGAMLDRLKPWAAAMLLELPAAQTGQFLDMQIYLAAGRMGRRTVGLETAAEQMAVFEGLSPPLQLALLDVMIKNAEQLPQQLEELTRAYLEGDLAVLDQVARRHYAAVPAGVVEWVEQTLLAKRNERMLRRLQTHFANGTVLVAVGAMHLPGDRGLVAGLRQLGFAVARKQPGAVGDVPGTPRL